MLEVGFLALFLLGLAGAGHCVAMCGGLSSAFVLQLPPNSQRWQLVVLLNFGRIASYTLVGALLGGLGQIGLNLDQTQTLQFVLFFFANILLFFLGLYFIGLSGLITRVEQLGKPIWRVLNKILQKLLPIRTLHHAFFVGMIWGWLPCGLVYTASVYALSSGDITLGALYMLTFAVGTLPALISMGFMALPIQKFIQKKPVRIGAGLILTLFPIWQITEFLLHRIG